MSSEKVFKITVSSQEYLILRTQAVREDILPLELVNNLVLDGIQRIANEMRSHAKGSQNAVEEVMKRPLVDPYLRRPIISPDDISGLES